MRKQEARMINTNALAYMGDAVYETAVRKRLLDAGKTNVDYLHRNAVRLVRAENQALAVKALMEHLTEEEQALVRRARNRKITSSPKNLDPVVYKLATAFEALIGYLYLMEDTTRMQLILDKTFQTIDENGVDHVKR